MFSSRLSGGSNLSAGRYKRDSVGRFFASGFFHESFSPQPLKITSESFTNFFENSLRYSQIKMHHQSQRHRRQRHRRQICCRWLHWWQICHRYKWHRRQILLSVSLVLSIQVANLPPVSRIPVATCHGYKRHRWQIATQYQRHLRQFCQRQIWEQFLTAVTLKWTWKKKCIYVFTLLPKGVQTK